MRVPLNSGVSDTVDMFLIPSSSLHSQCRQVLSQDRSAALSRTHHQTRLRSSFNCLAFFAAANNVVHDVCESSQTPNRASQRNTGIVVRVRCSSHRSGASLPHFLWKLFTFLPGLTSFSPPSFVTLRRFLRDILSPNVLHVHIDCASFSSSALPLPRGTSSLRRSPSISTAFQTLDKVSLLKFLVVFASTQSPAPLGLRLRPE